MTQLDIKTAIEVATYEALIRQTYKDSEGVLTWSIGITAATGHEVKRYIGKPSSVQNCINVYIWALEKYAQEVDEAFGSFPLKQHERAGAISFHWNTGKIKTASWVKKFKAGDRAGAERAFLAYNKPKSIIGRRKKEADLIFRGKWSQTGLITEYTKVRANLTPIWASAVKIMITPEVERALAAKEATETRTIPIEAEKPLKVGQPGQAGQPVEITMEKGTQPTKEVTPMKPVIPNRNWMLLIVIIAAAVAIFYFGAR